MISLLLLIVNIQSQWWETYRWSLKNRSIMNRWIKMTHKFYPEVPWTRMKKMIEISKSVTFQKFQAKNNQKKITCSIQTSSQEIRIKKKILQGKAINYSIVLIRWTSQSFNWQIIQRKSINNPRIRIYCNRKTRIKVSRTIGSFPIVRSWAKRNKAWIHHPNPFMLKRKVLKRIQLLLLSEVNLDMAFTLLKVNGET